jgi:hypothetical protein
MNTTNEDELDQILNKFGGLLMGRWLPRPGEEGMVYPVRLQSEAKAAITHHIREAEVRAKRAVLERVLEQAITLTNEQQPGGTLIQAVPVAVIEQAIKSLV